MKFPVHVHVAVPVVSLHVPWPLQVPEAPLTQAGRQVLSLSLSWKFVAHAAHDGPVYPAAHAHVAVPDASLQVPCAPHVVGPHAALQVLSPSLSW